MVIQHLNNMVNLHIKELQLYSTQPGAVNKVKKKNVKLLRFFHFFVYSGYNGGMDNFKQMYGSSASSVDSTNLMALTKTLNKLFQ